MKKLSFAVIPLFISAFSFSALAAEQVSNAEVDHFKLVKIATITVSQTQGVISSPMDLHDELSKRADEKGGMYYRVVAATEHGPNFEAVADVYNVASH
ncbi:putative exported protein [Trabulsiella guamensis ATCC 49490]|uniref:Putative exported protein n=1 Tax=Trabulsiella guamensis ATCC 49490 TaxID=1005994 RepID=A0A085A7E8_9ENTR|nr:YdgH/BhsA/McbA-like domain containing protein [Trabulsiella guamensis]KFC06143.1 putative exported protein [Trabulsiella guamensis ATCC 49490]